jgi:hypothetical protein
MMSGILKPRLPPERDGFEANHHRAPVCRLSMISAQTRLRLSRGKAGRGFPDHALAE